jgi:hypothetical protein
MQTPEIIVLYLFLSAILKRMQKIINIKRLETWPGIFTSFPRKGKKYTAKSPSKLTKKATPISLTSICLLLKGTKDKRIITADRVDCILKTSRNDSMVIIT